MVLCHLPAGPTAEFKLMNARLVKELKVSSFIEALFCKLDI